MNERDLLDIIVCEYRKVLHDNLVGIYIHGSIAFGCFHWENSDIDFVVVTREVPSAREKEALIKVLIDLEKETPPKGMEMSVVLLKYCQNFVYPTPFELHFSNFHKEKCKKDLKQYCAGMNGTDWDLAAHFTIIREAGLVLWGKKAEDVFGMVPRAFYLDSIRRDTADGESEIFIQPVYVILNLCRVLAFIREGLILSKEQGGLWGINNLPPMYHTLMEAALKSYSWEAQFLADTGLLKSFAKYMEEQIKGEEPSPALRIL